MYRAFYFNELPRRAVEVSESRPLRYKNQDTRPFVLLLGSSLLFYVSRDYLDATTEAPCAPLA